MLRAGSPYTYPRSSDVCELIDGWVLEHIADVEVAAQGGVQTRRKTSGDQGIGALIEEVPDRIDMRNFHQIAQNSCDCLLEEVSRLPSRLRERHRGRQRCSVDFAVDRDR